MGTIISPETFVQQFGYIHGRLMASLEKGRMLTVQGHSLADQALTRVRTLEALRASSLTDHEIVLGLQRSLLLSEQETEKTRRRCARLEAENEKAKRQSSLAADEVARLSTTLEKMSTTKNSSSVHDSRIYDNRQMIHKQNQSKKGFISETISPSAILVTTSGDDKDEKTPFQIWQEKRPFPYSHSIGDGSCGGGRKQRETLTTLEIHRLGHISQADMDVLSSSAKSHPQRVGSNHFYKQITPLSTVTMALTNEPASIKSNSFPMITLEPRATINKDQGVEKTINVSDKWSFERAKHHDQLKRSLARIDNVSLKLQGRIKEGTTKGKSWSG
jgi:hypothetical protein